MAEPTTINITIPLNAPAKALWGLFRDFANWQAWSPLYTSETIIGQVKDGVGLIRHNETVKNITYEDVLKVRDDEKMHMEYHLLNVEPKMPIVNQLITTITVKPIDEKHSQVVWESKLTVPVGTEKEKIDAVVKPLKSFYKLTIKAAYVNLALHQIHANSFGLLNKRLLDITKALLVGQNPTWQYADYDVQPLPKMVKGLPAQEALPPMKVGQMLGRLLESIYIQANNAILASQKDEEAHQDDEDDFTRDMLSYVGPASQTAEAYGTTGDKLLTKYLAEHWDSDIEFCQQYLQGVNPLQIQVVKSIDDVPCNMKHLKAQGKDLKELIHEKRLFIADYKELDGIPLHEPLFFYAPTALFYNEILPTGEKRLNVVGIRLERTDNATVYTPDMPQTNRWKLAKMFVACADNQVHQFALHLGIAHLCMEPICVAVHNKLQGHPLEKLLKPHLQETIGINFLARQTLIASSGAFTNETFALGTVEGVKLAAKVYKDYDFYGYSFPQHLKARGFDREGTDGLTNYLFRDDGFRLWDLIENYVANYVNEVYHNSDDEVKADKQLQEWAVEMSAKEKANIPGFNTAFASRAELIAALHIIIWNGSALHSFLNFPQWPYVGNIPNRPNAMYTPMPADSVKDITEKDIKKALAPAFGTAFQLSFPWALSLPSNTTLLDLGEQEKNNGAVGKKFHESLLELTELINNRNAKLIEQGKAPYPYLLPENVAASVDI